MPLLLLLAVLAFGSGGRPVAVDKIVAELWPDDDGDMGMRSFDVTLLRLRRLLGTQGREAIRLERQRVSLDKSICWTDVETLETICADIESSARQGKIEPARARARSEELLALYRGPFGIDHELPPSLVPFQDRMRLRVSTAIASLGRCFGEALGDAEETLYVRALKADPRLTLHVQLVRCLARRGQQRKARELVAAWRLHEDADELSDLSEAERLIGH
jgi:DNA-binding SARP family transcriptional activator